MAASTFSNPARMRRRHVWLIVSSIPLAAGVACWWLTAALVDDAPNAAPIRAAAIPSARVRGAGDGVDPGPRGFPDWPEGRLEGKPGKQVLLDSLLTVQERLKTVAGYTATFRKQERINGVLGPEQTMAMKLRHHPFAVYFKYQPPYEGKEVVYAEGHHENKIIAHYGGVARFLVPRLAVLPDHPLALAETRHAITEAGLASLTDKLVGFRQMDLDEPEAVTILDRTTDPEGRPWLRSLHTLPHPDSRRPFARVEVLYDPETRLPLHIHNYDWPEPGHHGEFLLAERYSYSDLDFEAVLTDLDFDPANPAYDF